MDGDAESNYAYFCLHQLHMLPSEFLKLSREEMAFVIAAIQIKQKNEKEAMKKAKKKK